MSNLLLDIQRRHSECFRLRLGDKGPNGQPRTLLKAIRVTSYSPAVVDAFCKVYGGERQAWDGGKAEWEAYLPITALEIMVLPGQSISQRWERWRGSVCERRCTGVWEELGGRECVCPEDITARMESADACRPTTRLSILCPDVEVVGAGLLVTRGLQAAETLPQSISVAEAALTRGLLVPAVLRVVEHKGKRHYVVPQIEIVGVSLRTLETGERASELAGPPQKALAPPAPKAIEAPKAKAAPSKASAETNGSGGGITDAQLRKLHALLRGRGVGDDERHAVVSELVGHEVTSTKDLTKAEASEVIDKLATAETRRTTAATPAPPPSTTAGGGVFVRAVQTALGRAGLDGAEGEAFIAWVTGGKGLDGPGPSNEVLAAAKRFDAGEIVMSYGADGAPTFAEKASA